MAKRKSKDQKLAELGHFRLSYSLDHMNTILLNLLPFLVVGTRFLQPLDLQDLDGRLHTATPHFFSGKMESEICLVKGISLYRGRDTEDTDFTH